MTSSTRFFYPLGPNKHIAANYNNVQDDTARPVLGLPLEENISGDRANKPIIVIVGGGYTGLSAAYHLARKNDYRVIVLEAGNIGQGPSGKSAGHLDGLEPAKDEILVRCGFALGSRLVDAVRESFPLVRELINSNYIPCDVRDGYIKIDPNGNQIDVFKAGEGLFGIAPYPFVLGMAHAAKIAGAEIYEHTLVTDVVDAKQGCTVLTPLASIKADYVIAAGGHRMAETIPALAHLRRKTTEVRITTIITDPLPESVINKMMPGAKGKCFPFCTYDADVAYGSIDGDNRLIFGWSAKAFFDPNPKTIKEKLFSLFPSLPTDFAAATGKPLATRILVGAEKINYTKECLPLVGQSGQHQHILYVAALGGHGIAVGTLLGKATADKIHALRTNNPSRYSGVFDDFSAIPHGWLPPWKFVREAAAAFGLWYIPKLQAYRHHKVQASHVL